MSGIRTRAAGVASSPRAPWAAVQTWVRERLRSHRPGLAVVVAAALAGGLPEPAWAVPAAFTGTLEVQLGNQSPIVSAPVSGTLEAREDGSIELPAGVFEVQGLRAVPASPFVAELALDARNQAGGAGPRPFGFGGSIPLQGILGFGLMLPGLSDPTLSFPLGGPAADTAFTYTTQNQRFFSVGASFASWTTGPTAVSGTLPDGGSTVQRATGSHGSEPTPGGLASRQLQLVTATAILVNASDGATTVTNTIPAIGRLRLSFVPEPRLLLLQGAAVALALGLAWRCRR